MTLWGTVFNQLWLKYVFIEFVSAKKWRNGAVFLYLQENQAASVGVKGQNDAICLKQEMNNRGGGMFFTGKSLDF